MMEPGKEYSLMEDGRVEKGTKERFLRRSNAAEIFKCSRRDLPVIAGRKARDKVSRLLVESDLAGISIDLPPPLAKVKSQAEPFRLEMPFTPQPVLHLNYSDT